MTGPGDERLHEPTGPGFAESVTFGFADEGAALHGLARIGVADGQGSALLLVLSDGVPALSAAIGAVDLSAPDLASLDVGGVVAEIERPLAAWRLRFAGSSGSVDLRFIASTGPIDVPGAAAAAAGGYEQLCAVEGEVVLDGRSTTLAGVGQRGHAWGVTDWEALDRLRTIGVWLGQESGVLGWSARPASCQGHESERTGAALIAADDEGPYLLDVEDARLSTISDAQGRQLRAGMELWVPAEDGEHTWPHRLAGEAVCGATLELGRLVLDAAFFRWRMEGASGPGCYHVLRRA